MTKRQHDIASHELIFLKNISGWLHGAVHRIHGEDKHQRPTSRSGGPDGILVAELSNGNKSNRC